MRGCVDDQLRLHRAKLMRLALLMLVACGSAPVVAPKILKPNVREACARAIKCEVFLPEQADACVNCVETKADEWTAELKAQFGDDLPPIDLAPCEIVAQLAHDTRLSDCVVGRWYGP